MIFSDLKTKVVKGNWDEVGIITNVYVVILRKEDLIGQMIDGMIRVEDGISVLNRVQSKIGLYFLLCCAYTDIEFDEKVISDKDYDFLAMNKFSEWLRKKTDNDSFEFEKLFNSIVIDEIRRRNTVKPEVNEDMLKQLEKALEDLKNIDPNILKLANFDNKETKKIIKEMVENDTNNESSTTDTSN